jgi:hypothetical protein
MLHFCLSYTHTHTHTYTYTHTHAHAHTHTRTHTRSHTFCPLTVLTPFPYNFKLLRVRNSYYTTERTVQISNPRMCKWLLSSYFNLQFQFIWSFWQHCVQDTAIISYPWFLLFYIPSAIHIQYKNIHSIIYIQYKNIQLLSANTDKHSYDSLYPSSMYHTSTEM